MIKPKRLTKGDKIAIVSLSSGILGEEFAKHQIELGTKRLKEMGLVPVFMPNSTKGMTYIKDNPEARANDLKQAFADDSISGVLCAIGGDDTYKTIPYLMEDKDFINNVQNNPKVFIGFSDSTNNHMMFNKLGLVTYYGLNFLSDIAELDENMLPYTKASYDRFFRNDDIFVIESSDIWYESRKDYSAKALNTKNIERTEIIGHDILYGTGITEGILFGGCLDSIYDMYTGDRYSDQKEIYEKYDLLPNGEFYKDKILFLETSEEQMEPSKFRKIFELFKDKKILENVKGLIVGKPVDEKYYDEYKAILIEYAKAYNIPTIYNVNFGHSIPRAMIPYGVKAELNLNLKTITIKEPIFASSSLDNKIIKNTTALNYDSYYTSIKLGNKQAKINGVIVFAIIAFIYAMIQIINNGFTSSSIASTLIYLVMIILLGLLYYFTIDETSTKQTMKEVKMQGSLANKYRFEENQLYIESLKDGNKFGITYHSYEEIIKYVETEDFFIIFIANRLTYPVKKSNIYDGNTDELKVFLSKKVTNNNFQSVKLKNKKK